MLGRAKTLCALCQKPLKNKTDAGKRAHDRVCPGFRALHEELVSLLHEHLSRAAAMASAPPAPLEDPIDLPMAPEPAIRPPSPPPQTRPSGLPNRRVRLPARFKDAAPPPAPRMRPGNAAALPQAETPAAPPMEQEPAILPTWIKTEPNMFGLYKVYPRRPTHDPDEKIAPGDLYEATCWMDIPGPDELPLPPEPWHYPFPNASVAHLMKYHIEEENANSINGMDRLVSFILQPSDEAQSDGVNIQDLPQPWSTKKFLDDLDNKGIEPLGVTDAWQQGSVKLKLPCAGVRQLEDHAPEFTVGIIHYRPLLDPIREVLSGPLFDKFHTTPFSLRFDPDFDVSSPDIVLDDDQTLRKTGLPPLPDRHEDVYAEIYTSSAMLEAYAKIPQPPPSLSPNDPVESIVVAIMEWSDATHLAQFGTADLWPAYTFFGNHSKAFRGRPTSNAGFHQAYFVKLPDTVRDAYREHYGKDMPDEVFTHLRRDLMHQIWELLLSDDFMDAYDNGIIIRCYDGLFRLVFPRFFIYGADYPEKVLLATLRSMGGRPCPRCFIQMSQIPQSGTANDKKRRANIRADDRHRQNTVERARKAIFEQGAAVSVESMLKENSWNAFSKLNTEKTPFNFYTMFVPDLLHEIELGVAKAIITHLLRMLAAFHNTDAFDERFRQIETFGRGTIRKFTHVSSLKHMAARNFEDILQCILPVVEGLFPRHQKLVDQLCFELAVWHGYAKLRMHTTSTIAFFRVATDDLLFSIRRFERESADVKTFETDREETRRKKAAAKGREWSTSDYAVADAAPAEKKGPGRQKNTVTSDALGMDGVGPLPATSEPLSAADPASTSSRPGSLKASTNSSEPVVAAGPSRNTRSRTPAITTSAPDSEAIPRPKTRLRGREALSEAPEPITTSELAPGSSKSLRFPPPRSKDATLLPVSANSASTTSEPPRIQTSAPANATSKQKSKSKSNGKLEKSFNLKTYKLHTVGDYPDSIVRYGTTDSTSTQVGELAHQLVKLLYRRTNKREHAIQIARLERRRRLMRAMWDRRARYKAREARLLASSAAAAGPGSEANAPATVNQASERRRRLRAHLDVKPNSKYRVYVPPEQHHYISDLKRSPIPLSEFGDDELDRDSDSDTDGPSLQSMDVCEKECDPALKVQWLMHARSFWLANCQFMKDFHIKLKTYFYHELEGTSYEGVLTDDQLAQVIVEKDVLYGHATMQVNYTTDDLCREQDVLNLRARRFFIVYSPDPTDCRYWYGEVLGIYHAYVSLVHQSARPRRIQFLWVRWFQRDRRHRCGLKAKRLPRVSYVPHEDPVAFGFLDPTDIVRGAHLIPAFHHGRTTEYLPTSVIRPESSGDKDWVYYYANMVVDRDMLMRYHDNVIGHRKIAPPPAEIATVKQVVQTDSSESENVAVDRATERQIIPRPLADAMISFMEVDQRDGAILAEKAVQMDRVGAEEDFEHLALEDNHDDDEEEAEGEEDADWRGHSDFESGDEDSNDGVDDDSGAGEVLAGEDAILHALGLAL
uniref:Uncharacterized protein n=1 Tax=Mycena chlorophos TaxID=658473 RepID=A0ABQ0M4D8_MYCCL|nr:predicted protein [Mycena chlorophos]